LPTRPPHLAGLFVLEWGRYDKGRCLNYFKSMNISWLKNPLTIPLLLIITGVVLYLYLSGFFSGPLVLEEKTFPLGDKTILLLTPKGSEKYIPDPTQQIVSYG